MSHCSVCNTLMVFSDHAESKRKGGGVEALRQMAHVVGRKYPTVLLVKNGVKDIHEFTDVLDGEVIVKRVPNLALASPWHYNAYCLNPEFYENFLDFDYVMINQLDGWWFHDSLQWFADKGFDYWGSPWFGRGLPNYGGNHADGPRVGGNGGMSLRNVRSCLEFARKAKESGWDFNLINKVARMGEDAVFSNRLPYNSNTSGLPRLRYPDYAYQSKFSWEQPHYSPADPLHPGCVELMQVIAGTDLPMAIHQPHGDVRQTHCLPEYEDPEGSRLLIVMFSSAIDDGFDYGPTVGKAISDHENGGGDVLVVTCNGSKALWANKSTMEMYMRSRRLLTVHNNTVEWMVGPFAYHSGVTDMIRRHGYRGRHETLCLKWRPGGGSDCVCTYDGDVPATEETKALRSIGTHIPVSPGRSPTAGFMAYAILRRRYPKAKIMLVDYFGNSRGYKMNFRHDPELEQKIYDADRGVLRMNRDLPHADE